MFVSSFSFSNLIFTIKSTLDHREQQSTYFETTMSTEDQPTAQVQEEVPAIAEPTESELKEESQKLIAEGKKAIALKQWEEGVNKYGEALDIMRQLVGEFDPQMAPLLLSYGKALYELAFSQQGVMGKEEVNKEADGPGAEDVPKNGNFVFSADPASDDEAEAEGEDPSTTAGPSEAVSASASAPPEGEGEGEGEEDEPEDDYNAAWEVLDVARTIYQRLIADLKDGEGREERLNLSDCYLALGDVSCETENFPQAVQDYSSALEIKSALLPSSSRAVASVHYQLATVLEFTPGRRADALSHVEKALQSFKARLAELEPSSQEGEKTVSEEVGKLSDKEKENEIKDVKLLLGDLEVKIEELKTAPQPTDIVSDSIYHLLGQPAESSGSGSAKADTGPINDLTSMVKKKKPRTSTTAAASAASAIATNAGEAIASVAQQAADAAPTIDAIKEKVGYAAVSAGQAVQTAGEGLKRDANAEQGDAERPSKKAKAE